MNQLRALVVGLGRMGTFHARVLRDLGYEVTTVDPDPQRFADFTSIANARIATATALERFDVAAVACPAEHLLESASQLAGTRMLIEKPFAMNVREAEQLARFLKYEHEPVCVGFIERFNPRVRELRARLDDVNVEQATFVRWNDRPSADPLLDLTLHDVDLMHHLFPSLRTAVDFDTRADQAAKRREIHLLLEHGFTEVIDLMAHDQSPLHALWHAFLTDADYPKPEDAVHALRVVEQMRETEKVAAA